MPALNFPDTPTVNQTYTADGRTWIWTGTLWDAVPATVEGPTGPSGVVVQTDAPIETDVIWLDSDDPADAVAVPAGGLAGQSLVKIDGTDYNTAWTTLSPNYIINGAFDIWQRGTSLISGNGVYLADRFQTASNGNTWVYSRQSFTPAELLANGFGDAKFYARVANTTSAGVGNFTQFLQRVEDVQTLAGQTVTLSYWAKADAAKSVVLELQQNFGSGGSSSVNTFIVKQALTTSWARYTHTFTVPSTSGKTIGSSSYADFRWWLDAGSNFDSRTGSLGQQNITFDIWGVQLEAGSVATPFRRNANSIQGELAACQRYYQKHNFATTEDGLIYGAGYTTGDANFIFPLVVELRSTPTAAFVGSLTVIEPGVGNKSFTSVSNIVAGKKTGRFEGIGVSPAASLTVGKPLNANAGVLTLSAEL